jgi:hypothetical protein
MLNLTIRIKPSIRALGQPLRMAAHTLDWVDPHPINAVGGGKQVTMVMMVVLGVVLMLNRIIVLFLP